MKKAKELTVMAGEDLNTLRGRSQIRIFRNDGFAVVSSIQGACIGLENMFANVESKITKEQENYLEESFQELKAIGERLNKAFDLGIKF